MKIKYLANISQYTTLADKTKDSSISTIITVVTYYLCLYIKKILLHLIFHYQPDFSLKISLYFYGRKDFEITLVSFTSLFDWQLTWQARE
jgi:hypothetical protein